MQVEHGNHKCEHCGAKVPAANTCPCCGKDHSDLWIANAKKEEGAAATTIFCAGSYFIFKLIGAWNLPFSEFVEQLLQAGINSIIIAVCVSIVYLMLFGINPTEKEIEAIRKSRV